MEVLSKKRKREPCFFLEKLFKIISNKKNNKIIHWNDDGTRVVISDPMKFSQKILLKNFKHDNYSSFIRQLNIYGFTKINNIYKSTEEQFFNEKFRKNTPLKEIKNFRRKNFISEEDDNDNSDIIQNKKENKKIIDLINKQENDEQKIEILKLLINNNNLNNMINAYTLEFLIEKSKERNDFNEKTKKN